ncbi:TPA: hypothetical protein OBO04_004636 [Escherichia coli]|nr:hypothetical protein [Escherichia coli]HCO5789959.1 hypothetical protein [Escherichia coli]
MAKMGQSAAKGAKKGQKRGKKGAKKGQKRGKKGAKKEWVIVAYCCR